MPDPEVSDHDLADQRRPAWPTDEDADEGTDGHGVASGVPVEADPADVLEQHLEVPLIDDEDNDVR